MKLNILTVLSRFKLCLGLFNSSPYQQFLRDGGDRLLTQNLRVMPDNLVIDFGGYRGDWSHGISKAFDPHILIVEPIPQFVGVLRERFKEDSKIEIYPFMVGSESCERELFLNGDATSIAGPGQLVIVKQRGLEDFIGMIRGRDVDLVSINIEGGEYELLEILLESNCLSIFRTLLIQFHREHHEFEERYARIQSGLSLSHRMVWDYPFIWQRWDRRD
jgi:FkbM family methyltransferase